MESVELWKSPLQFSYQEEEELTDSPRLEIWAAF